MPLREYQCPDCGLKMEVLRPFHEEDGVWCPECSHAGYRVEMVKRPSAPAFSIKGFSAQNGYSNE